MSMNDPLKNRFWVSMTSCRQDIHYGDGVEGGGRPQCHLVMSLIISCLMHDVDYFLLRYILMGPMASIQMSPNIDHLMVRSLFSDIAH